MVRRVFSILATWVIVVVLFYYYVWGQLYLVISPGILVTLLLLGIVLSATLSGAEMAIATADQRRDELERRADQLKSDMNAEGISSEGVNVLDTRRNRILNTINLIDDRANVNTVIVIWNNVINVAIVALMPFALNQRVDVAAVHLFDVLGTPIVALLPGSESFTLVAGTLSILIFGEIVPKRLAMGYSIQFVERLYLMLRLLVVLTGWLGTGFGSIERLIDAAIGRRRRRDVDGEKPERG